MTELLEQAISLKAWLRYAKIKNLPDNEQDTIAAIILEELEEETKWEQSFANSQDLLANLAAETMQEYQAGEYSI
ncbi:MAG: hypothetical protein ACRC80_09570 [Waterburya sp.]